MTENQRDKPLDDEAPLDPAAMLAIVEHQQRSITNQMGGFVPVMTAVWGAAWLLGFGALFAQQVTGFPLWVAIVVFVLLLLGAAAVSTVFGIRAGRGIRASWQSRFTGTVYGVTWSFGSLALSAIGGGLMYNGMSDALAQHFYPAIYLFFIGIMYIIAGAIWPTVFTIVSGGQLVLIGVISLFIPQPFHLLFLALAAGLGFFVLAILHRVGQKRPARG